jgi:hypothetical protein
MNKTMKLIPHSKKRRPKREHTMTQAKKLMTMTFANIELETLGFFKPQIDMTPKFT